jgi:predicted acylesterase/phospholipase RssA
MQNSNAIPVFDTKDIQLKMKQNEKLALVLPGGGSFGRWQMGPLYWLYQIGILNRVDFICGNSVGGLNTLITAKYIDNMDGAVAIWNNITKNSDVYKGMMQFNTFWDWMGMVSQILKDNKGLSILNPDGLYKLLDTEVSVPLSQLKRPVYAITSDLAAAEVLCINSIQDPDFMANELGKCTSAIPAVFPLRDVQLRGQRAVNADGGIVKNDPIDIAIKNGATKILLIGTSPDTIDTNFTMKTDIISMAQRLEPFLMHFGEESSWSTMEQYKEYNKLAPDKYPTIEFLTLYPNDRTETGNNSLDFTNTFALQKGLDHASKDWTKEIIEQFLLA